MILYANPYSRFLTAADVAEIDEARFYLNLKKSKIVDRAWYIFKVIAKHFKIKLPDQYEYDLYNLGDGYIDVDLEERFLDKSNAGAFSEYFLKPLDKSCKAIVGGVEYDFSLGKFPYRWLFIDFESELVEGIRRYDKSLEAKKNLESIKRKRYRFKSKIVKRLKKNMTEEEIEIVFGKE